MSKLRFRAFPTSPPLLLTELREALEDVEQYNYREFDAESDDGKCADCEHMGENGNCSVLEMGVSPEWTCDEFEEAAQEEADEEVANLIADGTAEETEEALPPPEKRAPRFRKGKKRRRMYQEAGVGPFGQFLAERRGRRLQESTALAEHNVVPHGPGHGGKGGGGRGGGPGALGKDLDKLGGAGRKHVGNRPKPAGGGGGGDEASRNVLRNGKKFAGADDAGTAMTHLKVGDKVQVGFRGRGTNSLHRVTGNIESTRGRGGFNMRERNGNFIHVKPADMGSLKLEPPKAPRRARPEVVKHFNDALKPAEGNLGEALSESADLGHVILDEAAKATLRKDGTFPVKIIDQGWGTSGYYSGPVLKRAAEAGRFPRGLKMYWNHPTKSEATERPERSLTDLAAVTVAEGKWREDGPDGPGVYADAKAFQQYRPYIEELAPHIGISMRGYGNTKMGEAEGKKGALVEDIVAVQSADFVTQAGRGGKILQLFEAARTGAPINPLVEENAMDPQEIQELQEANTELMESTARLQEQLAIRDARDMVRDALESSGLPPVTRQRLIESLPAGTLPFVDTNDALDRAAFATKIEEAVKAEKDYIQSLGGVQVTGLGESGSAPLTQESAQAELNEALTSLIGDDKKAAFAIAGRS